MIEDFTEQELIWLRANIGIYTDHHSDVFYSDTEVQLLERYIHKQQ